MALSASATTTTSSTSSPTAPVPNFAFTTPFPQPESCSSLLTTTVSTYSDFGTTSSRTFLLPDTSNPRYAACLAPASHFTFSPAVCPQGWVAWWLGRTSALPTATSPPGSTPLLISTAYCCAPGYSMLNQGIDDDPSPSCKQAFVSISSLSNSQIPASTTTLSVAMLPAWHISWQTTDLPTLSPRPPTLDSDERFTQWVPGTDLKEQPRDNWAVGLSSGAFYFLVIGIPLLVVTAVVACIFGCRARGKRIRPKSGGA